MLKLTLRPGEFIDIGKDIRVIFSGGSANNIHLLVDAPRTVNIARSSAGGKNAGSPYFKEKGISEEAKQEIRDILRRERSDAPRQGAGEKSVKKEGSAYVVRHR